MSKYITIYKGKTLHLENVLIMDVVKVNLDSTDSMESADDTYLNSRLTVALLIIIYKIIHISQWNLSRLVSVTCLTIVSFILTIERK